MQTNRRDFLKTSLATAAICGLARQSRANDDASTDSIVDTHVYLGHWPHQRLPGDEPTDLAAMLRGNHIRHAWVGSFDGLFHKDIAGVNQRLAETSAQLGNGMFVPFGAINPTLPDWEEDVRRCSETFRMPGIRLHPNYHGYTLDDPRFARLLELATARNVIVQLVAWMEDERHLLLDPHAARVDLKPLAEKIEPLQKLKLVVANGYRTADDEATRALLPMKQVYFDFARADTAAGLASLFKKGPPDRIIFGSCSPLHRLEAALPKLQNARLSDGHRRAIASENARTLLAETRKTSATEPRDANRNVVSTR